MCIHNLSLHKKKKTFTKNIFSNFLESKLQKNVLNEHQLPSPSMEMIDSAKIGKKKQDTNQRNLLCENLFQSSASMGR